MQLQIGLRLHTDGGDPAAYAAPVKGHAHDRADAHRGTQFLGNEVIELPVERRNVDVDASD
jgi:hypothetical protein